MYNEEYEISEGQDPDTQKNIAENNKSKAKSKMQSTRLVRLILAWAHVGKVMNLST